MAEIALLVAMLMIFVGLVVGWFTRTGSGIDEHPRNDQRLR